MPLPSGGWGNGWLMRRLAKGKLLDGFFRQRKQGFANPVSQSSQECMKCSYEGGASSLSAKAACCISSHLRSGSLANLDTGSRSLSSSFWARRRDAITCLRSSLFTIDLRRSQTGPRFECRPVSFGPRLIMRRECPHRPL
jgi:hypothetical protein